MNYEPIRSTGYMESPAGLLLLTASRFGLEKISFTDDRSSEERPDSLIDLARLQLQEYFNGTRQHFSLPLNPHGSYFQLNVWEELRRIPFGKTISYEEMARRLGDVKVIRAAATANGRNPLPIVIPCHRVIGKDGSLTGYSGGLQRKKWLLDFELSHTQLHMFDAEVYGTAHQSLIRKPI